MELTQEQLAELAKQINELNLKEADETNAGGGNQQKEKVKGRNERQGDNEPVQDSSARNKQHSDRDKNQGNDAEVEQLDRGGGGPKRVKLGTPPTGNGEMLTVDSLNGKSVEWMAENIEAVNKLVAV